MHAEYFRQKRLTLRIAARDQILRNPKVLGVPNILYPALTYCLQSVHQQYHSQGYIINTWEEQTIAWQLACVIKQTMPTDFMTKEWDQFSLLVGELCIQFQDLDPTSLKTHWSHLLDPSKFYCYKYQTMPTSIIESDWQFISYNRQLVILNTQYLSMDFILRIWYELPAYLQRVCFTHQKITDRVSMAELPMFLVAENRYVRKDAVNKVTEEVTTW